MDSSDETNGLDAHSKLMIDASEKVMPSVVRIDVRSNSKAGEAGADPERESGSGSGMIFTPDGLILTEQPCLSMELGISK